MNHISDLYYDYISLTQAGHIIMFQKLDSTLVRENEVKGDKKKLNQVYYDLTAEISEKTVVFPGDPQFQAKKIYSLDEGHTFGLCHLQFGNQS